VSRRCVKPPLFTGRSLSLEIRAATSYGVLPFFTSASGALSSLTFFRSEKDRASSNVGQALPFQDQHRDLPFW